MTEFDDALEALKMHLGQDTQRSNIAAKGANDYYSGAAQTVQEGEVAPGVTWNPDTGRYEGNVTPQQQASTYERKRDRLDMPKWRMPSLPYALTDPNRGAPLGERPLDAASAYFAGGLPRDNRPDNRSWSEIAGNTAAYAGNQAGLGAVAQFLSPLAMIPPSQAAANRGRWDEGAQRFAEDYPGVHAGVRAAGDVAMASGMPEGFGAMPVAMTQRVGGLSDAAGRAVQDAPNSAGVLVVPKAGARLAKQSIGAPATPPQVPSGLSGMIPEAAPEASKAGRAQQLGYSEQPFYRGDNAAPQNYDNSAFFSRDQQLAQGFASKAGVQKPREFRLNLQKTYSDHQPITADMMQRIYQSAVEHDPQLAKGIADEINDISQNRGVNWFKEFAARNPNATVREDAPFLRQAIEKSARSEDIFKGAGFDAIDTGRDVRKLTGAGIRLKNAAFDPKKKDSTNIMWGLGGLGTLGAASYPSQDQH
jgi:hypothetical protein